MEKEKFNFSITTVAANNLEKIIKHISVELKNIKAADDLINKIYDKIEKIRTYPYLYPAYSNKYVIGNGIRKAKANNILIFYTIDEKNKLIIIHSFIHSKMIK